MTKTEAVEWINAQDEGLANDEDWTDDLSAAWLALFGRPRDMSDDEEGSDSMAFSMLCSKVGAVS